MTKKKQWYVTVGVPGGEYAFRLGTELWDKICRNEAMLPYKTVPEWRMGKRITVRPAPPELVEWIEAPYHGWDGNGHTDRMKADGGWLYRLFWQDNAAPQYYKLTSAFVPVALASGLTVIRGEGE